MPNFVDKPINIEVAFALPDTQVIIALTVSEGTTIDQAITLSGISEQFSEIAALNPKKVGIFGKIKKTTDILREGDRIEIYRPLIADPKASRRKRAASASSKKSQKTTNEAPQDTVT